MKCDMKKIDKKENRMKDKLMRKKIIELMPYLLDEEMYSKDQCNQVVRKIMNNWNKVLKTRKNLGELKGISHWKGCGSHIFHFEKCDVKFFYD
jgi:hypothetical protein